MRNLFASSTFDFPPFNNKTVNNMQLADLGLSLLLYLAWRGFYFLDSWSKRSTALCSLLVQESIQPRGEICVDKTWLWTVFRRHFPYSRKSTNENEWATGLELRPDQSTLYCIAGFDSLTRLTGRGTVAILAHNVLPPAN